MSKIKIPVALPSLALCLGLSCASTPEPAEPAAEVPEPAEALEVGDEAPDFELVDQNRESVRLSSFRGDKNVVVAFYVLAFTGG